MTALWAAYSFQGSEMESWAAECASAAVEMPEADREGFLAVVCEGSPALLERTRALVAHIWDPPPASTPQGSCRPGETVCGCVILRLAGRGGAGEVYRAIQRSPQRAVAVKVAAASAARLSIEAANVARLQHPNIVTVFGAETGGDRPCIVMELVEGSSVRAWMTRHWQDHHAPPPAARIRTLIRDIAVALDHAHAHGVVHLDVKPENVLLDTRGDRDTVKLVDFGIATRVATPGGSSAGTPGYMSPERINAAPPDRRADVFALGVILCELLTGKHPFEGRSPAETFFNTLRVDPQFPGEDGWAGLVAVARKALQKTPEFRYQTAAELIADLDDSPHHATEHHLNPFLSELPLAVGRWWSSHSSGAVLAFVSFLWGSASLGLSAGVGAACVRVQWAPVGGSAVSHWMLFGYAVEPNAGLWYLAGMSFIFLAGCAFLEAAFRGLARTRTLEAAGGQDPDPLSRVGRANLAVFRYALPVLVAVAVCFVAIPEIAHRPDHAFGWVQADLAGGYNGQDYERLKADGKIGDLPPVEALCGGCRIRVAQVLNRHGRFEPPSRLWFAVFLALALTHQAVLAGFMLWIVAKILFFFWILSTALLGGARHGLRLVPDFNDSEDYRFGLARMDNVYYAVLWVVLVASLGLFLQAVANVTKGTYFFAGDPAPALFGQAVSLLGIVAMLLVVMITPLCVLLFLNINAVDQEVARLSARRRDLHARLATETAQGERDRIQAELSRIGELRKTVGKQSLLPIRQPAFLALVAANAGILLLSLWSIPWFGSATGSALNARLQAAVCAMSGNPQSPR